VWSVTGILAEVPTGALADRFSRRAALAASTVLQAAGYVLWIIVPGYAGFAAGFALWGLGGALGSGSLEALMYDGLAATGAEAHYPRLYGRVSATRLISQLPAAGAATVLFATGGYPLVGWVSVASCLTAAVVALGFPDRAPTDVEADEPAPEPELGYVATLRAGLREVRRHQAVLAAVVAVAVLGSLDGLEEYFSLLAHEWGVTTRLIPMSLLAIPAMGAAGAAMGGMARRLRPGTFGLLLAGATGLFIAAGALHRPVGIAAVAVAYALYQVVLVVTDARLQAVIEGPARATVTSVASLGVDLCTVVLYAAWALDQPALLATLGFAMAAALPAMLGSHRRRASGHRGMP
jgi:MFS family permease